MKQQNQKIENQEMKKYKAKLQNPNNIDEVKGKTNENK